MDGFNTKERSSHHDGTRVDGVTHNPTNNTVGPMWNTAWLELGILNEKQHILLLTRLSVIEEVNQTNGNDSVDGGREYIGDFYRDLSDNVKVEVTDIWKPTNIRATISTKLRPDTGRESDR